MTTENLPIIRDERYRQTLRRDMARYHWRRVAHRWWFWKECLLDAPGWLQAAKNRKSPTLSVCIITMNSSERIVPLLKYCRTFCDELVVGVDSKTTDNTLAVCEGLADELFVIDNGAPTCNGGLADLVARCHGDWVLRLDDDEFPEPHLARYKTALMTQPRLTHYKLPRLHICETRPLAWVNDGYLYPDYQMRLFKNDKALLSFPGAVGHTSIECAGPRGKIHSVNLVHLNLAINPRWKREEKLRKYVLRHEGAWVHPVNEHALLYEDFGYRIQPYHHPDTNFCRLLRETTDHQRAVYEAVAASAV
ncbi:MAG: glycosyltransferase [Candidatus Melainabacteria bacterium]